MWAEELKGSGDLLYYRPQVDAEDEGEEPTQFFRLALCPRWTVTFLLEYGHLVDLQLDGTASSNHHRYPLTTLLMRLPGSGLPGIPIAALIHKENTAVVLTEFLNAVHRRVTTTKPSQRTLERMQRSGLTSPTQWQARAIVCDDCDSELLAIRSSDFEVEPQLCCWHARRAWLLRLVPLGGETYEAALKRQGLTDAEVKARLASGEVPEPGTPFQGWEEQLLEAGVPAAAAAAAVEGLPAAPPVPGAAGPEAEPVETAGGAAGGAGRPAPRGRALRPSDTPLAEVEQAEQYVGQTEEQLHEALVDHHTAPQGSKGPNLQGFWPETYTRAQQFGWQRPEMVGIKWVWKELGLLLWQAGEPGNGDRRAATWWALAGEELERKAGDAGDPWLWALDSVKAAEAREDPVRLRRQLARDIAARDFYQLLALLERGWGMYRNLAAWFAKEWWPKRNLWMLSARRELVRESGPGSGEITTTTSAIERWHGLVSEGGLGADAGERN